jgi:ribosomal protein S18 acetylase RimI-like enzyme
MNRPSPARKPGGPRTKSVRRQTPPLPSPVPRLHIERARRADLEALVALEQECFDAGVAIPRQQFRYLLARPTADVWVCRCDGHVAADAVVLRRRMPRGVLGRLYSLAVAPGHRGRGHGRRLLQFCLETLRCADAYAAVLEVRPDNAPALRLYTAAGFRCVALLPDYYAAGVSAARLRREF